MRRLPPLSTPNASPPTTGEMPRLDSSERLLAAARTGAVPAALQPAAYLRPYDQYIKPEANTAAPRMFPRVTGRMLFIIICPTVTFAPQSMPCGIMNMFATECSNPSATNMEMGQKMAKIFPATDVDAHK